MTLEISVPTAVQCPVCKGKGRIWLHAISPQEYTRNGVSRLRDHWGPCPVVCKACAGRGTWVPPEAVIEVLEQVIAHLRAALAPPESASKSA